MYKLAYLVLLSVILSSCWPSGKIVRLNRQKAPRLQTVIAEVQRQYKMVLDSLEADKKADKTVKLEITEAELTLKVTKEASGSGGVKVLIFKPSGSYTNSRSTAITYTLSQNKNTSGSGSNSRQDFTLRDMILSSARELNSMNVALGRLTEKSFSIDLSFSIEVSASGELTFDVGAFSIEGGASNKHTAEHGLKLSFTLN